MFDLNLSMKPAKKFFVCKCKVRPPLLYLADMFINNINKLKTIFNSSFEEILEKLPRKS